MTSCAPTHAPVRSIRLPLLEGAILLWTLVTTPIALLLAFGDERLLALPALACGPAAFILRRQPYAAGFVLVVGAAILRIAYIGWSETDPIELSRLASNRAFSGENPYLGVYETGSAYSYGPLGLLTYRAGILGEFLATIGTSMLLLRNRAWMTLALFGAWPLFLFSSVSGNNDYSVGFLLILSLVVMRSRPRLGMVILAAATAVKPYAAAWFLPAAGFAGGSAALIGGLASVIFWSPVIVVWGIPTFVSAVQRVDAVRESIVGRFPSWAFADLPVLRLIVVPISLAGLMVRSWPRMLLLGAAGFIVFLGFAPWAHHAYLGAVVPVIGLALESERGRPASTEASSRKAEGSDS